MLGRDPYDGTAWVELGIVPGGYGWVFPKGDHANLGVGGWMSEGPRLRAHLDRLAREHGVDPATLENVRGHRLPMREPGAPAARGRLLLVGDAAGLVDPLSGDGMYEAFVLASWLRRRSPRVARRATRRPSRRARSSRIRVVEGEACRRPVSGRVPVGAPRSRRLRRRHRPSARRPCASERGASARPSSAARALAARQLGARATLSSLVERRRLSSHRFPRPRS